MKKFFTLFIILILLPVTALAEGEDAPGTLYVSGTQITSGGYWITSDGGTTWTSQDNEPSEGGYIYYDGSATLTLKDATIKGGSTDVSFGAGIYAVSSADNDVALTIVLVGTSTVSGNYGVYVQANQNSDLGGNSASLKISGDGTLTATGTGNHGIDVLGYNGGAALTIEKATVNASTSGDYAAGVCVQSGSQASNSPQLSLAVNGGSLTASGGSGNSKGIRFYVGNYYATKPTTSLTVGGNAIVDAKTGGISATQDLSQIDTKISATGSSGGIVFDGTEGTVYGDVKLDKSLTINQGETLTVPAGSSLDCNDKLTNNGTILVSGGTLEGTLSGGTTLTTPNITQHPQSANVNAGETATFTVATDSSNPSYQWQQSTDSGSSWTNISDNATTASYTITNTTTDMNNYQYRCVVTASGVGVISNAATLTVNDKPVTPTTYTISADVTPTDAGSVTVNGSGTSATVTANSEVTLTATANEGYRFTGWTSSNGGTFGDASSANTTFTMPAGDVTVTAQFEKVAVTGVTLNTATLELFTGENATLTAAVQPSDATNQNVTWQSDNANVATVQNGTVTAVGAGTTTITVTTADGGYTASCEVKVRNQVEVKPSGSTNLSFTTDRDEFTLIARVYGNDLDPKDDSWTWTVADADVVALSGSPTWRSQSYSISRQTFTVEGTGTTIITATYDDGTYRGSVNFSVRISKPAPPDPISYYNIYVEDVCDGVEVSLSKSVVREGNSISVYVEKDTANYTFDNFQVYYKRSYYGPWEVLEEGVQPGEYPINNIWTHIYIKAEGVEEKEDPTGIEQVEGVKVYTKDGSLYVQTPQRETVIIVSMTGAVVKNEEQVGLKQYHGLQPGIYIVRIGERTYKLRLN